MENKEKEIQNIRVDYIKFELYESEILKDPVQQFKFWFEEALNSGAAEANAMTLSTAGKDGKPSARIVLLKDITETGFTFYTNYSSRKGDQIAENPYVALNFFWHSLERQVRIEGKAERLDPKISVEYFNSRPIGSRIGAIISPQSKEIPNREFLEEKFAELTKDAMPEDIACPENWGGYLVIPEVMEFWQGRQNRLHDRLEYFKNREGHWQIHRLAP